jgi:hypothetical protein
MGARPLLRLEYGRRLGVFDVGARVMGSLREYRTIDTRVATAAFGGGLVASYERPLGLVDLRGWLVAEVQIWRQHIALAPPRTSWLVGWGGGFGLRVPVWNQTFAELSAEAVTYTLRLEEEGVTVRPAISIGLAVGQHF